MNINSSTLTISMLGRQVLWSPLQSENNIFWDIESPVQSLAPLISEKAFQPQYLWKLAKDFWMKHLLFFFQKGVDKLKSKLQRNVYACINKDGFSDPKEKNGSTKLSLAVRRN